MKTVGIIAEYNPFHNGHAYQIAQARQTTGADCVVVVMSGNFVQRGAPAWTDKYLRTEMALSGGADLVLELPAIFATASAQTFAYGGVSLLHGLGFVDYLCFGSECGDLDTLSSIASFLQNTDETFQTELAASVRSGMTYPAARAALLTKKFPEYFAKHPTLLTDPNNILGIEYLKALRRLKSSMKPITIVRKGNGYHDDDTRGRYLSASAIRQHYPIGARQAENDPNQMQWTDAFPAAIWKRMQQQENRLGINEDDFSEMLYYKLRTAGEEALAISDMTPALWNRIQQKRNQFTTITDFIQQLKTKQYTYTRISRALCHLLLDIRRSDTAASPALYARILGFRGDKTGVLRAKGQIPLITKMADAEKQFSSNPETSETAKKHMATDLLASDLYRHVLFQKNHVSLPDEYRAKILKINN